MQTTTATSAPREERLVATRTRADGAVDPFELRLGVLDYLFGRGPGARLGEHVDNDVFGDTLGQPGR